MPDDTRCPLCDAPNRCGVAAGQPDCWCFTTTIPEHVRAQVAEADQNRRCLCESCAAGAKAPDRSGIVDPAR